MVPLRRVLWFFIPAIWTFLVLPAYYAQDHHTTFVFNHFNGTNLLLRNDASIVSKAIRLTNDSDQTLGRALYSNPVQTEGNQSFSTTFVFCMVPRPGSKPGHGLAFMMTPNASSSGVVGAQYLGLLNNTSDGAQQNHLFAVEFDTVLNIEFKDIDNNHVGVDLNSLESLGPESAGYWIGGHFRPLVLNSGQNIQAWIDYDLKRLNVSITLAGRAKPIRPLISLDIDLSDILEDQMFVGFSAATATFIEEHYILAWSFSTEGTAPALDLSHLPSFIHRESIYRSTGFVGAVTGASVIVLLVLVAAMFQWLRRTSSGEMIEEWELEYWPHRFPYKELRIATGEFSEKELLGSGGFGRVYRGILPGSGVEVAVKCISKEVTQGMQEFIAEISSMGRLQHRNLVQLRGWCRNKKRLCIVYDYMPNGSLDRMLFGSPNTVLPWSQRYKILKGVATGLLYLHEEWEKRVVHRDIKSSNVLLDSELNARLGDFGLARLYDHTQNAQTTRVVGTLGYIAPELVYTGKATPSSDVFSFGAVLLEVACGRRPVEPSKGAEELILLDRTWELYAEQKLLDAVDPKLGGLFDEEEATRVLQLGLLCSHPEPEERPTIRQVLRMLEGEVPVPVLQIPSFNTSILSNTPPSSYVHITDGTSCASSAHSGDYTFSTGSSEEKTGRLLM